MTKCWALPARTILVLTILVLFEQGCSAPSQGPGAAKAPGFAWTKIFDGRMGMTAGGARWWKQGDTEEVRFTIHTTRPVNLGVVPREFERSEVISIDFVQLDCVVTETMDATRECKVPNNKSTFLISDNATGKLQWTHIMSVKIVGWRCVSDCPPGMKEAGKSNFLDGR